MDARKVISLRKRAQEQMKMTMPEFTAELSMYSGHKTSLFMSGQKATGRTGLVYPAMGFSDKVLGGGYWGECHWDCFFGWLEEVARCPGHGSARDRCLERAKTGQLLCKYS